jgi:23S rRNA pseudouridine1911/1915/1917 synthase
MSGECLTFDPVDPTAAGQRLDAWLTAHHPALSRARWQELIKAGSVTVDGTPRKPNHGMRPGEQVVANIPPPVEVALIAQDIALDVLFEDADLIAINKPPGLVVHPAPGHADGTLVNALLHHCTDLAGIGGELRPGIVHRLDRDTSGVLVVAKNESALQSLATQFKDRHTEKTYAALVWGLPRNPAGTIRTLIGRDPVHRQRMSAKVERGRVAISHYRVIEAFGPVALVRIDIETGRTHQIRVHLAHLGHPVVGDPVYGRRRPDPLPAPAERQMLHAERLRIIHPRTGQPLVLQAPWPPDFTTLHLALKEARTTPRPPSPPAPH